MSRLLSQIAVFTPYEYYLMRHGSSEICREWMRKNNQKDCSIVLVEPNKIYFRGHNLQELVGLLADECIDLTLSDDNVPLFKPIH